MCVAFLELRRSEEYFPKNALFSFKKKEKKTPNETKRPNKQTKSPPKPQQNEEVIKQVARFVGGGRKPE